jgi:hypothetical protein
LLLIHCTSYFFSFAALKWVSKYLIIVVPAADAAVEEIILFDPIKCLAWEVFRMEDSLCFQMNVFTPPSASNPASPTLSPTQSPQQAATASNSKRKNVEYTSYQQSLIEYQGTCWFHYVLFLFLRVF